ncbi:WxL domain-containing protein [Levilactobacillus spicheri]|uniref:WxL domain-containing protein n=1 Tax=Levilactobacillus spicheri TaxID=216463 RepID=A0A0F3RX01_9LACO|nr:WxL domain-containing protein [Levilactobacillus spicheri]KJW13302.1 hypothetical protein VC81_02200 [Levilactobacillus spicheri]
MTSKFTLALLATSIGLLLPLTALADTAPTAGTTSAADSPSTARKATLEIDPGTVSFKPDSDNIVFASQNVQDLTKPGKFDITATESANLILDNYLGSGNGWKISAEMTPFTAKNSKHVLTGDLWITPRENGVSDEAQTSMTKETSFDLPFTATGGQSAVFYTAKPDSGMGEVTFPINYKLDLHQAKYAGHYSATLTYTFAETADSAVGATPTTAQ